MANTTLKTKILLRSGTTQQWMTSDIVLGKGEFAIELLGEGQVPKIKIGDGTKTFTQLPYFSSISEDELAKLEGIEENAQVNVIEEVQIGSKMFTILDKIASISATDARAAIGLGSAATRDEDAFASSQDMSSATSRIQQLEDTIRDLTGTVEGVTGAMHYKGTYDALPGVESFNAGDVVIVEHKEYVLDEKQEVKTWHELGDEGSHITKEEVANKYVSKDTYQQDREQDTETINDIKGDVKSNSDAIQTNKEEFDTFKTTVETTYSTTSQIEQKISDADNALRESIEEDIEAAKKTLSSETDTKIETAKDELLAEVPKYKAGDGISITDTSEGDKQVSIPAEGVNDEMIEQLNATKLFLNSSDTLILDGGSATG